MNITLSRANESSDDSLSRRISITRPNLNLTGELSDSLVAGRFLDLPALDPSRKLLTLLRNKELSFRKFSSAYRLELARPTARQFISLLTILSFHEEVSIVCLCKKTSRCLCTILQSVIETKAAQLSYFSTHEKRCPNASPVCYMEEF